MRRPRPWIGGLIPDPSCRFTLVNGLDRPPAHGHNSQMKTASISQLKNGLSSYVDLVRAGESVLVTDRGVVVARLEPAGA